MYDSALQLIAKNLNLKVIDCSKISYWKDGGTGDKSDYINKSYISGNEIILGIYNNPEFRLISFFHEVGHFLSHKISVSSEYENERIAWEIGFIIAASHGVFFSDDAEDFANKQLKTYDETYTQREPYEDTHSIWSDDSADHRKYTQLPGFNP